MAIVERLLDKGAKVDEKDDVGLTALHLAAVKGYTETAVALLTKGAAPFRDPGSMAQLHTMLAAGGEGTHLDEARKDMDAKSAHTLFAKLLNPENDLSDHPNSSVVELHNFISGKHPNIKDVAEAVRKRQTLEKDKLPWQQPEVLTQQIQFGVRALVAREMKALEKQIEADESRTFWQGLARRNPAQVKPTIAPELQSAARGWQERHAVREQLEKQMATSRAGHP